MSRHLNILAACSTFAIATVCAGSAMASCKNLVCVKGSDDGAKRTHIVRVSNQLSGATHYYVVLPGGEQFELHVGRFQFDIRPGHTYRYSVQVCKKGGWPVKTSTCAKWAKFTYKAEG